MSMTRERPILFSAPMVRQILAGEKTQTRRLAGAATPIACPKGEVGDFLWVREKWQHISACAVPNCRDSACIEYAATPTFTQEQEQRFGLDGPWKTPIFMPRWASRITLRITDVRAERLQNISECEAVAEGASSTYDYAMLWNSIHGSGAWELNPWVWKITFEVAK